LRRPGAHNVCSPTPCFALSIKSRHRWSRRDSTWPAPFQVELIVLHSDRSLRRDTVGSPNGRLRILQQLEPLASNLDIVRRGVEQLAAQQEQMARNIATLQAVDEDIRQKVSSPPPSPSQQAASIPQQKPPQPRMQPSAVQSSSVPRPPPPAGPTLLSR
jgi:hypothetical protein